MVTVRMYTTAGCPFCTMAERMLVAKGVTDIVKTRIDLDASAHAEMIRRTGQRTVPQIYIGENYVGGYRELAALQHAGKLEELLGVSKVE
jgi:glutaredoxin 3